MKKRQRMLYGKRLLVAFLSACMLVANTPLSALAAEDGGVYNENHGDMKTMQGSVSGGDALPTTGQTVSGNTSGSHSHGNDTEVWSELTAEMLAENNVLAGNYYLSGNVTTHRIIQCNSDNAVRLCLNGHTLTCNYIDVDYEADMTIEDCSESSTGTIQTTSASCAIAHKGTLHIRGGKILGNKYGITSFVGINGLYLSGTPEIAGSVADIEYSDGDKLHASENGIAYSGSVLTLEYNQEIEPGETIAVVDLPEATENEEILFQVSEDGNYEIRRNGNNLVFYGKPQELTWYAEDGVTELSGENYPESADYGSRITMPVPTVAGEIFLGWQYRERGSTDWSSAYWQTSYTDRVKKPMEFKACFTDSLSGEGTEANPYLIKSVDDLTKMSMLVNSENTGAASAFYRLDADIDMSAKYGEGKESFVPIGNPENPFSGTFDGNGKTISGLYVKITGGKSGGLFGVGYDGEIKNLILSEACVIAEGGTAGILLGAIEGAFTVKDCILNGGSVTAEKVGSIVGQIDYDSTVELSNNRINNVEVLLDGYTTDSNQMMGYKQNSNDSSTDIKAKYQDTWIQTTYYDVGYEMDSNMMVEPKAEIVNGGRYVKLSYTVTAEEAVTDGKLAVHADTQIGDNDYAKIEVIRNGEGKAIGLKMVDDHENGCTSQGAQFNLYFSDTGGVSPVSTYWFGRFGDRASHMYDSLTAETQSSSGAYGEEFSSYANADSGIAWSWQGIELAAGESRTFSVILGVGERAEPPKWDEISPITLTLGEGDGKRLDVAAQVSDAVGQTDTLYYNVNGGTEQSLGSVEADGTLKEIIGSLEIGSWTPGEYELQFWIVNSSGAASESTVRKITVKEDGSVEGLDGDHGGGIRLEVDDEAAGTEVNVDQGSLAESMNDNRTLIAAGNTVEMVLTVENQTETVSEADKRLVEGALYSLAAGTKVGDYFDIQLERIISPVGGGEATAQIISETDMAIRIVITIPENMRGGTDYKVIRVHDGSAEVLPTTQNGNQLTFESNRFSTYAIAYTPAETTPPEDSTDEDDDSDDNDSDDSSAEQDKVPVIGKPNPEIIKDKEDKVVGIPNGNAIIDNKGNIVGYINDRVITDKDGIVLGIAQGNAQTYVDKDGKTLFTVEGTSVKKAGETFGSIDKEKRGQDNEPKTGDSGIPIATLAMVAGMTYVYEIFRTKKGIHLGITESQKNRAVDFLVKKAKGKGKIVCYAAIVLIFLILAFYHSVGKAVEVDADLGVEF